MDLPLLLLSFPPDNAESLSLEEYDKSIRGFLTNLTSSVSQSKLAGSAENGQDLLELLDPSLNTASYLAVLNARLGQSLRTKPNVFTASALPLDNPLTQSILAFLGRFDPIQVRYLGHEWRRLFECVHLTAIQHAAYTRLLVQNLSAALLRLDASAGTFTTNHLYFVQACVASQAYKEALPILRKVHHSFPGFSSPGIDGPYPCSDCGNSSGYVTVKSGLTEEVRLPEVQQYYVLGAMAYIGLRMWEEAFLFLELVLLTPNQSVANGYMLEAYKKWILVGCLLNGRPPEISKAMNNTAMRTLKLAARPYDVLGDVFATHRYARLCAEIEAGWGVWRDDGNVGLCKELIKRLKWFHILDLQKVYAAVPLSKVATHLDLAADRAYVYLEELVVAGQLNATLSTPTDKDGEVVVRFHTSLSSGPLAKSEEQRYAELVQQTGATNELAGYVRAADQKLSLNRHYIESLRRKGRIKGEDAEGVLEQQEEMWQNDHYPEEDLMEVS